MITKVPSWDGGRDDSDGDHATALPGGAPSGINIWPGWESLSFLTADTTKVLWLVNASLIAGVVADLVYARYDPPWLVALGGVVTTAIALAALIRIMQVFPVDSAAGTSTARCWSGCC